MSGRLKMDQIAAATGYSVSTVSRVLGGKACTSDKARESIIKCARKLGVLDELSCGRLLINGIAVFAPERTFTARGDIFYQQVTRGIADTIAPHDVWLSFSGLEEQRADVKLFLDKVSHKNVNAVIVIGTDDDTIFKLAATLNKPCVLINTNDRERVLDAVSPDHRAIGFNIMRYLFERGHRQVLSLTCLRRETLYARLDGMQQAYRHFYIPFDMPRDLIVTEGFSTEESAQALEDWLEAHPRAEWPSVIFAGSASMMKGVQQVLARRRLKVPEDISLITNDFSWNLANALETPVTGIELPCHELGVEAVHLLQNRLNRPHSLVVNLLLQARIREAGSVSNGTRHAARIEMMR